MVALRGDGSALEDGGRPEYDPTNKWPKCDPFAISTIGRAYKLTDNERSVLLWMAQTASYRGHDWRGTITALGEDTGLTRRKASAAVDVLVKRGLLDEIEPFGNGREGWYGIVLHHLFVQVGTFYERGRASEVRAGFALGSRWVRAEQRERPGKSPVSLGTRYRGFDARTSRATGENPHVGNEREPRDALEPPSNNIGSGIDSTDDGVIVLGEDFNAEDLRRLAGVRAEEELPEVETPRPEPPPGKLALGAYRTARPRPGRRPALAASTAPTGWSS